jgi:phosphatidylglycerophosphate synthase
MPSPRHAPAQPLRWPTRRLQRVPALLVALRFTLGPLLSLDAADGATSVWFLVGLAVAFLSDVFDGVLARRLGVVSTAPLPCRSC